MLGLWPWAALTKHKSAAVHTWTKGQCHSCDGSGCLLHLSQSLLIPPPSVLLVVRPIQLSRIFSQKHIQKTFQFLIPDSLIVLYHPHTLRMAVVPLTHGVSQLHKHYGSYSLCMTVYCTNSFNLTRRFTHNRSPSLSHNTIWSPVSCVDFEPSPSFPTVTRGEAAALGFSYPLSFFLRLGSVAWEVTAHYLITTHSLF